MLEVGELNVFYGDLQALWDITFTVGNGELVSIIGPNGSGKTTLLKAILGLIGTKSGKILFDGRAIENQPTHEIVKGGISLVPEGRRIFPHISVWENLELGGLGLKTKAEIEDSLRRVCRLFPVLEERRNQLAGTLSGGEQQMLAIGRAIMMNPKLLMLDEPSLGLAPLVIENLYEAIDQLSHEEFAVLLVEQNVYNALKLAHRAYVIETGRIVMEGNAQKLLLNEHIRKAYLGL